MSKEKMKAAHYSEFGEPETVNVGNIQIPELKETEVLVKIKAAGVNPVDAVVAKGYYKDMMPHSFPVIPGWDMAGVIEKRGHAARRFEEGDEVYGYARRPEVKWGTFAEYIVVPESYLAKRPKEVSWEEAAGVPLAALTAYQAVYEAGNLQQGQKILIIGASGGVGSFAVQLSKARGAEVIGVASEKNHEYMRSLGADHTIDYEKEDIGDAAKKIISDGVDLIFDCTSGDSLKQSLKSLKSSGKLVSILNQGEDLDKKIDFQFVFCEPNSKQLDHLREILDAGDVTVKVNKIYSLQETPDALKQIQTLHTTGKIVIVP